jgi:hypothetical protein
MKKSTELFIGQFVYPLLIVVITGGMGVLLSKIITGNWFTYFERLKSIYWLLIVGVIVLFFIIRIILDIRLKTAQSNIYAGPIRQDNYDYQEIDEITYASVVWPIMRRVYGPYVQVPEPSPDELVIDLPPRCPKCRTDLEQKKAFWGYYKLSCPRGDFHKRRWKSYHLMKESVQRIVCGNFRNALRNTNN